MASKDLSLVIDTTQNNCYLLLFKNKDKIIDFICQPTKNNMTDIVVEMIDQMFQKHQYQVKDVANIYLVNGPGSFTGCRVGFIIATTLVNNLRCKLYAINSLLFQTHTGNGISLIDAHSNKDFLAVYEKGNEVVSPQLIQQDNVDAIIQQYPQLQVYRDYENLDFCKRFFLNKSFFKLVDDLSNFEPLYIKGPISNGNK